MKKGNDNSMWRGAPPTIFSKAKKLRNEMTEVEMLMWEKLRSNRFHGYKFRRQHPISIYVADFYCHQFNLIIEVDGEYHNETNQLNRDEERTKDLNFQGMKILRFTNDEIKNDINAVLKKIKEYIDDIS